MASTKKDISDHGPEIELNMKRYVNKYEKQIYTSIKNLSKFQGQKSV